MDVANVLITPKAETAKSVKTFSMICHGGPLLENKQMRAKVSRVPILNRDNGIFQSVTVTTMQQAATLMLLSTRLQGVLVVVFVMGANTTPWGPIASSASLSTTEIHNGISKIPKFADVGSSGCEFIPNLIFQLAIVTLTVHLITAFVTQ